MQVSRAAILVSAPVRAWREKLRQQKPLPRLRFNAIKRGTSGPAAAAPNSKGNYRCVLNFDRSGEAIEAERFSTCSGGGCCPQEASSKLLTELESTTEPRVLVTGATGLVGRAIVRALLKRSCPVRILVRDAERARALFGSQVEIYAGDLGDREGLRRVCVGVGKAYHVAGAVDTHRHRAVEILDTNVEGTRRLLEAARAAGVSRIVYTSSVSVYGDRLPRGVAEDAPVNPAGVYGVSKARAERLVQEAAAAGLCAMIVRPCIVYGPGDRYFLPQALQIARLPIIPLPDAGCHIFDVVHADDLAAAQLRVMEAGQSGEAYNVTDSGCHRARDLIRWIAEMLNRTPWRPSVPWWFAARIRPLIGVVGRFCGRPDFAHLGRQELIGLFSDYHFNVAKIAALGYAPCIDARAGLQSEIRRVLDT